VLECHVGPIDVAKPGVGRSLHRIDIVDAALHGGDLGSVVARSILCVIQQQAGNLSLIDVVCLNQVLNERGVGGQRMNRDGPFDAAAKQGARIAYEAPLGKQQRGLKGLVRPHEDDVHREERVVGA
jgi:hypothetical protein